MCEVYNSLSSLIIIASWFQISYNVNASGMTVIKMYVVLISVMIYIIVYKVLYIYVNYILFLSDFSYIKIFKASLLVKNISFSTLHSAWDYVILKTQVFTYLKITFIIEY